MSLRSSIVDELRRSPVTTISGLAGVAIAALSFGLALIQYRSGPLFALPAGATSAQPSDLFLGNVFLVVAYFLAVTVAASLFLRAIARKHDITAFFASIPLIALTNFSAILVMYLAPPRRLSAEFFASAHDLVFYASTAILIAFCGKAILVDLASIPGRSTAEAEANSSSDLGGCVGTIVLALIILAVWSWLVFAGQTRLTRTLLPQVTHPAPKTFKSGASEGTQLGHK